MIDKTYGFLKKIQEHNSPHTFSWFGTVASSISSGLWATALTDWLKRKEITINGAANTADFTDDFTSYADTTAGDNAWATSNTAMLRVNPSNDNLDIIFATAPLDNSPVIYNDLTGSTIDDTAWVCRYKLDTTALVAPGNYLYEILLVLSSTTTNSAIAEDAIGLKIKVTSAGTKTYEYGDYDNLASANASEGTFSRPWAVETVYVEMKRLSATSYSIELFSDSSYTSSLERKTGTCASTTNGLRYFKVAPYDSSGHATGNATAVVDDISFWDGITTVENIPSQQTVTVSDPLTSDLGWVHVTSDTSYDATGDEIDFTDVNSTFINAYIDLQDADYLNGSNLDDNNFVIRGVVEKKDNPTDTANGTTIELCVSSTITDGWFNDSDSVGIVFVVNHTTGSTNGFSAFSTDAQRTYLNQSSTTAYDWQTGLLYWEINF